jgi:hypothetical protein
VVHEIMTLDHEIMTLDHEIMTLDHEIMTLDASLLGVGIDHVILRTEIYPSSCVLRSIRHPAY